MFRKMLAAAALCGAVMGGSVHAQTSGTESAHIPVNFPANDPDFLAVTDAYASGIAEELMFCGGVGQQWANTIFLKVNLDIAHTSQKQRQIFWQLTGNGKSFSALHLPGCNDVIDYPYAPLISDMNHFVISGQ
jgi:hypothetical protein